MKNLYIYTNIWESIPSIDETIIGLKKFSEEKSFNFWYKNPLNWQDFCSLCSRKWNKSIENISKKTFLRLWERKFREEKQTLDWLSHSIIHILRHKKKKKIRYFCRAFCVCHHLLNKQTTKEPPKVNNWNPSKTTQIFIHFPVRSRVRDAALTSPVVILKLEIQKPLQI